MSRLSKLREKYARAVVRELLAADFYLTVNNGVFDICKRERDLSVICDALFSNTIDRISVHLTDDRRGEPLSAGWVELDYTCDHKNMLADYSPTVAIFLIGLEQLLVAEVIEDRRKTR